MANQFFRFKQFTVYHHLCAMKVGTDGVLLGAWAESGTAHRILDVGTGSGLIALMLAQRSEASIDAIDISPEACEQALYNVNASHFKDRISVLHQDIQTFQTSDKYDLICCNPPFFSQSLKGPDASRNLARHNDSLPVESLINKSAALLNRNGKLAVIIPSDSQTFFHHTALENGLILIRRTTVKPTPASRPKRVLLEYSLTDVKNDQCVESELIIELERHIYSSDYIRLTRDFYLKME